MERDISMSKFSAGYIREFWNKLTEAQKNTITRDFKLAQQMFELENEKIKLMSTRETMPLPKKPRTCFILYCNANRQDAIKKSEGEESKDITRKLARNWKALPANEKQPYKDMYIQDRNRYYVSTPFLAKSSSSNISHPMYPIQMHSRPLHSLFNCSWKRNISRK